MSNAEINITCCCGMSHQIGIREPKDIQFGMDEKQSSSCGKCGTKFYITVIKKPVDVVINVSELDELRQQLADSETKRKASDDRLKVLEDEGGDLGPNSATASH